jgi:hypothetical protein
MAVNLFDSRFSDRITIFRMLSVDLLVTQKSTEHPHKLPNLIVKELPEFYQGKTAHSTVPAACVKNFFIFLQAGLPGHLSRARILPFANPLSTTNF